MRRASGLPPATVRFSFFTTRPSHLEAPASRGGGFTTKVSNGKDERGRERMHTLCGLLMLSSLVVTTEGLPLGMASARFWTRKRFKGTKALKRKINPTRVPIEGKESMRWPDNLRQSTELVGDPARCVHICDREGDIRKLFCLAEELDTHLVIRRRSDSFADDGSDTVESMMAEEKVRGLHSVAVRDDNGKLGSTQVELSFRRMTILPPIAKPVSLPRPFEPRIPTFPKDPEGGDD